MFDFSQFLSTPKADLLVTHGGMFVQYPDILERYADVLLRHSKAPKSTANFFKALALRLQGNVEAAYIHAEDAHRIDPADFEILKELALCCRSLGNRSAAIMHYRKLVGRSPNWAEGWKALAELLESDVSGNREHEYEDAATHFAQSSLLDFDIASVPSLLHNDKSAKAVKICKEYISTYPSDSNGYYLYALAMTLNRSFATAENLLKRALKLQPDHRLARLEYAMALSGRYKFDDALAEINTLLDQEPDNTRYLITKGRILTQSGRNEETCSHYEQALQMHPRNGRLLVASGSAHRIIGNNNAAVEAFRKASQAKPLTIHGMDAYGRLANLKTYEFSDDEIKQMEISLATIGDIGKGSAALSFALGKAYEDRRQFDTSFEYYRRGNETQKRRRVFDPASYADRITLKTALWTREFVEKYVDHGCKERGPIFIVGLPRSGSTLLEQIFASHSDVDGTAELNDMPELVHQALGRGPAAIENETRTIDSLPSGQLRTLGREYIERTKPIRMGAPLFVDKMLNNFRNIGFIHLVLPNAKFIDIRRQPMASCFSNYKQLFSSGQSFSYDLDHLGLYYTKYVELVEHWRDLLPGHVMTIRYEDVVSNTEKQVRRMLEFCELPFQDSCLTFFETKRNVRTISSQQVRSPIYSGSVEQWRNYNAHLAPLRKFFPE